VPDNSKKERVSQSATIGLAPIVNTWGWRFFRFNIRATYPN
jgi:hypothetical protein